MIGQFWGTSAAEGVPAPFCKCPVCEEARAHPEYRRLRTCMRLTEKIMLDLGADAVVQSIKYGDISELEHVLITHTHEDHLNPHMMMEAFWIEKRQKTLHYYFTDKAFDIVEHWRKNKWILKGAVPRFEQEGIVAFHNGCSMSKRSEAFRQPIFIGYAELNYTNLILHDNHCNGFGQIFLENL